MFLNCCLLNNIITHWRHLYGNVLSQSFAQPNSGLRSFYYTYIHIQIHTHMYGYTSTCEVCIHGGCLKIKDSFDTHDCCGNYVCVQSFVLFFWLLSNIKLLLD